MTDRERMINLLVEAKREGSEQSQADYILENGAILPPCRLGQTVYLLEDWGYRREIKEKEIGVIVIKGTNDFSKEFWEDVYGGVFGTFADVGKTIFLTKEEAEQALKEREKV